MPSRATEATVAVAQGFASHASIGMAKGAVEGLMLSLAACSLAFGQAQNTLTPAEKAARKWVKKQRKAEKPSRKAAEEAAAQEIAS